MRDEMSDNIDPAVELTRQAVLNYRAATEMPKALRIFAEQTNTRISVLRTRLAEAGATEEQLLSVFGEEKGTNDGDNATNALEELMRRMGQ